MFVGIYDSWFISLQWLISILEYFNRMLVWLYYLWITYIVIQLSVCAFSTLSRLSRLKKITLFDVV